ncbi:contractile injection system tape measure protein [Xenorhabdus griffiniae]|uniref:contractile injection system tape measure protein n=1 Tax=Xenorhabdus griffiniae TaxID=351672 RepID=UPI00235A2145|nr:contractile injection system tape measure protein [Xenorhabdus griffiniae]MDC9604128.1 contractile injection system tape measure protein [Xenorhabdus griffiniae]
MISLIKETNSTIYRVIISIESVDCYSKKVMNKCSFLFNKKLSLIIKENIKELELNRNKKILLERMLVDLGNIDINAFETEFPIKLKSELRKNLKKYFHSCEYNLWEEKRSYPLSMHKPVDKYIDRSENNISYQISTETLLIEKVDHYLRKGNWLFDDKKHHIPNIVRIDNQLWQQVNHQPQQWLPMLAKHCLQPTGLSRLMRICQPDVLAMLCQLFTEITSEFVNSQTQVIIDKKVTPEKLSLAAEYYLQHQMKHTHATQQALGLQTQNKQTPRINIIQNDSHLLKQNHNKTDMPMDAVPPFALQPTQIPPQSAATQQHHGLIKEPPATLQNRQQHKELPESTLSAQISSIQPDNGIQSPSAQSVLPISNAGCMILWPLLPTFFRTFDLLEKNQFISLEAQREAVCLLDWLIWEEEEIPAWRLTLNKVLCGLPIYDNSPWHTPEPEQRIVINQWLEKILVQLPAWKKMGVNDVRHLFLQRSGELSELNGITNIHIKPEVYDALISEWPWPMNIASFSWLQQPITITWL